MSADYYVSTTGSDANAGTSAAAAFATITHAASVASAGKVIEVLDGTYNLSAGMYMTSTVTGSAGSPITFKAASKWGAKITCNATSGTPNQAVWEIRGDYLVLDGFEIDGSGASSNSLFLIYCGGSHCTIQNCKLHDMLTDDTQWANNNATGGAIIGVDYFYSGATNTVQNNVIYNVGPQYGGSNEVHGIYIMTSGCTIQNNLVYNIAGDCISSYHHATTMTVVNNTVYYGKGGITIASNTAGDGNNCITNNNIAMDCTASGISEQGTTGVGNVYNNNQVYGNTTGISLQNSLTASNTLTTDPKFVSTGSPPDFHLQADSPCLGSGTATHAPATDLDGITRANPPSRGAYEN